MKKRVLAIFCAAALMLGALPVSAAVGQQTGAGTVTAERTDKIAHGAELTVGQITNAAGSKNEERILVHTPGKGSAAMVAYGNSLRGLSTAKYVASWLETNGYTPVAGTNGDFFMTDTGIPIGMVVTDGVLRTSDRGQYAIGFLADGSAIIGKPSLQMVASTSGGQSIKIDYINKTIQNYGVYLMNSDYSSSSRTTAEITYIRLQDPSAQLTANASITATVAEVLTTGTAPEFVEGELYLAATVENNNSARLAGVEVGQTVTITITSPDPIWAQAKYAVGAGDLLVENGETVSGLDTARHPRTAAGVREDGSLVLYTVDGRQSGWSVGMGLNELAARMKSLGCVTAVNLDGGGSTAMVAAYPGYDEVSTVNKPSDGSLRAGANYIFIVNTAPYIGSASDMKFYGSYSALAGTSISFDLRMWDENYHAIELPNDVEWSISGDKATLTKNGILTAGDKSGKVTVSAKYGALTASTEVQIVGSPDEIYLVNEADGTRLGSSIVLNPSDSISIAAECIVDGTVIDSKDENLEWSFSGNAASVDNKGTLTASNIAGRTGTLTVKAGTTVATLRVTVGEVDVALEDFEGSYANIEAGGASIHASIQSAAAYVARGNASGKLTYDFGAGSASGGKLSLRAGFDVPTTSKYLRMWVYGDGSANTLTVGGELANGSAFELLPITLDFSGYKQVSMRLPENAAKISKFTVTLANQERQTGTIYLDQIVASRTQAELTARPTISEVTADKSITPGSVLFSAKLADGGEPLDPSRIKVTLDGERIGFMYNTATCEFFAILLDNTDKMLHRLTIEAADADGNLLRYAFELDGGATAASSKFSDARGHWSAPYADYLYDRGTLEGNYTTASDGTMSLRPTAALTRAEFAVMMAAYLGVDTERYAAVELPYTDMSAIPASARGAVAAMYIDKIITGKVASNGDLFFDPQATITRSEIMTIIGRTLPKGHAVAELNFTDADQILEYAREYVSELVALGAVSGYEDGSIRPNNPVTRAEGIRILYGLY